MEDLGPAFPPRGSSARVSRQSSGTTFLRAFWPKPMVSLGGLSLITAFISSSLALTLSSKPRSLTAYDSPSSSRLTVRLSLSAGHFVPAASHPTVTSRARTGRLPLTEQRVLSVQDSCSCDFTSHRFRKCSFSPLLFWPASRRAGRLGFGLVPCETSLSAAGLHQFGGLRAEGDRCGAERCRPTSGEEQFKAAVPERERSVRTGAGGWRGTPQRGQGRVCGASVARA
jgi:hypothetical protein